MPCWWSRLEPGAHIHEHAGRVDATHKRASGYGRLCDDVIGVGHLPHMLHLILIRTDQLDNEAAWKLCIGVPATQKLPSDQELLSLDAEIYGASIKRKCAPCLLVPLFLQRMHPARTMINTCPRMRCLSNHVHKLLTRLSSRVLGCAKSFSLKHLYLVIMVSRPAPKPRMSDVERRAARGHTREDLVTRTKGHIGKLIQKTVVRPTLVGQERTKRRFLDFLQILSEGDPSVLEKLGCTDIADVLKPGAYMLPTRTSFIVKMLLFYCISLQTLC